MEVLEILPQALAEEVVPQGMVPLGGKQQVPPVKLVLGVRVEVGAEEADLLFVTLELVAVWVVV